MESLVNVDAKPQPITVDIAKTAVIVVDMQNDFVSKGGILDHAGLDISMNQAAIGPTAKVLSAARRAKIKVVYLKMGFKPDLSDLGSHDSVNRTRHLLFGVGQISNAPDGSHGRFLIRNTWNTDIVSELQPQPDDLIIYKHRFSGFFETDLDDRLKESGIKYLIFTGVTTCVCVESTLRDAMFRDYLPVVLADTVAEPIGNNMARTNHEASLLAIETSFGWVSTSDAFRKSLTATL